MKYFKYLTFMILAVAAMTCVGCEDDDTDFSDIINKEVVDEDTAEDEDSSSDEKKNSENEQSSDEEQGSDDSESSTTVIDGTAEVKIVYNASSADVSITEDVADYLTVSVSGADVSIIQSSSLADEVTYILSGSSTDGMFYMDGELKATLVLNGLTLTNSDGPAIAIDNGKRIAVVLADGTTNTLKDGSSGSQKACFMVNGHTEFEGSGTLNLTGNLKHAFWGDEYVQFKKSMGTINVQGAVKDGFNVNQYVEMNGGTVTIKNVGDDGIQITLEGDGSEEDTGAMSIHGGTLNMTITATAAKGIKAEGDVVIDAEKSIPQITITTSGGGEWDSDDSETKASSCIKADGNMTISAGTLTLTSTGAGGKGLSADGTIDIAGGDITVKTSGSQYVYGNNRNNSDYTSSPKGIKADGNITISGGSTSVTTTGTNGEGIESKGVMNITGGEITVNSYDDGLNSKGDMTISGGSVYAHASNNDGIDANGNCYIKGGLVFAVGASQPEVAIDANTEGGKKLYVTGGTLVAIGGLESGSSLTQTCYAASSWNKNTWYALTYGSTTFAFKTPSSGGNGLVVSASSTPTLKSGVTVSGGTSIFDGMGTTGATVSGGSSVSLSQYSGGNMGGMGGGPGGRGW